MHVLPGVRGEEAQLRARELWRRAGSAAHSSCSEVGEQSGLEGASSPIDSMRPESLSGRRPVNQRANKAPEPTPPSVTSPADAGAAPAGVVAHLER